MSGADIATRGGLQQHKEIAADWSMGSIIAQWQRDGTQGQGLRAGAERITQRTIAAGVGVVVTIRGHGKIVIDNGIIAGAGVKSTGTGINCRDGMTTGIQSADRFRGHPARQAYRRTIV